MKATSWRMAVGLGRVGLGAVGLGGVRLGGVGLGGVAHAERPVLASEATHGTANVLVHYATTGVDAPPAADGDGDGVPDFVAEVAAEAQAAYTRFASLGFASPIPDVVGGAALGGDARVDVYLRDLVSADGNAGTDACANNTCIGYAVVENDFAGYRYPSRTEAIRSVVPHELFHLVQYAYAMDQPSTWTEGTAVWAVEALYGDGNSDFERFAPGFLQKTFRPYERGGGGFGDTYPYGAALWPAFLAERHGPGVIVEAWTACRSASALDATQAALVARGDAFDAAWTDFTRANAMRAPLPPREVTNATRIYIEGLSARYVPLEITAPTHLVLSTTSRIAAAADGTELDVVAEAAADAAADAEPAVLAPGTYLLTVTGLARGTIATPVDIAYGPPPAGEAGEDGGCSSTPRPASVVPFVLLALLAVLTPRRRAG